MTKAVLLLAYYMLSATNVNFAFPILITLPMLILVIYNVALNTDVYISIMDIVWLCVYLFFVVGPLQAIDYDTFVEGGTLGGLSFETADCARAMLIPLIFFGVLTVVLRIFRARLIQVTEYTYPVTLMPLLLIVNLLAFTMFVLYSGGLGNLLAARYDKDELAFSAVATPMLALQLSTMFIISAAWASNSKDIRLALIFLVASCFLVVAQNPFNTARNYLLASYGPILLILMRGRIRSTAVYIAALFGMVFVMPVLNITSRTGGTISEALESVHFGDLFFKLPYIDVFDLLIYAIPHIKSTGFYYGEKTLGLLLFFVPREIWTSKATLTGLDIGEELFHRKITGTSNLSFFVGGDFYADLGYVGVASGAIIISIGLVRFTRKRVALIFGQDVRSYILLAAMPILIRGPLGANAPLTFTLLFSLALFLLFASKEVRRLELVDTSGQRNLGLGARDWTGGALPDCLLPRSPLPPAADR